MSCVSEDDETRKVKRRQNESRIGNARNTSPSHLLELEIIHDRARSRRTTWSR